MLLKLILRNIRYYRISWFLTLTGATIGTAVLTGALITGDSVKFSLSEMVRMRLGKVTFALTSGDSYFRSALADDMAGKTGSPVVPVLIIPGTMTNPANNSRINRVQVTGIDNRFPELWKNGDATLLPVPGEDEAIISMNTARRLNLKAGDPVILKITKEGFAPANAPFVSDKPEISGLRLKIAAIAGDDQGGRFSLANNQSAPFNIFVSHRTLSRKMGINGFVNTLLTGDPDQEHSTAKLNDHLRQCWKPEDAGLMITEPEKGVIQLSSRLIFIGDTLADAIRNAIPGSEGFLTYLVNDMTVNGLHTPYSFVTATDQKINQINILPGQIVINDWLADDLHSRAGDSMQLTFWVMGADRTLTERSASFRVQAVSNLSDSPLLKALMPDFPGMSGSGSCRDWETGAPVDLKKIRGKDEDYWKIYKGTPKAWISLSAGQKLWSNPFGQYTAFRFPGNFQPESLNRMMKNINPGAMGLSFSPVSIQGNSAAANSTDFGELFLSLGGLIVIAGLMLSGMMFSLSLAARNREIRLLHALGFRSRHTTIIFLTETLVVSITGSLVGLLVAIGYAQLIIAALNSLWQGAVNTNSLALFLSPRSMITGFCAGTILTLLVFLIIQYRNRKKALPALYPGTRREPTAAGKRWQRVLAAVITLSLFASFSIMINEIVSSRFYPSTSFMMSGVMLMAGLLGYLGLFLSRKRTLILDGNASPTAFGMKNLVLNLNRTMVTIILLALGTFTIMVTGLNRKGGDFSEQPVKSGTGGFSLWLETTSPLLVNLNSQDGLKKAGLDDALPSGQIRFFSLPGVAGDDASCLNLNQVQTPGLLGIPVSIFDQRQPFSFVNLTGDIDPAHPWRMLDRSASPGLINGFADQTVITWGLRKKTGDTLHFMDEQGKELLIRIAGGLNNSVFQGSILVSDSLLRLHYPSGAKPRIILIDTPSEIRDTVASLLETRLGDLGATVTSTSARLNGFNTVENTYLDVFIVLGGFGLLLGTAGLAVMILRSLRDRREEFALYRALGFPGKLVRKLLNSEFQFVLFAGVLTGTLSALAGTLPSWISSGSHTLVFPSLVVIVVMANGLFWIHYATAAQNA